MERFWVSFIFQDGERGSACQAVLYDSFLTIEEAIGAINRELQKHTLLSAWIETYDADNVKTIVFHECYVNAFGLKKKPMALTETPEITEKADQGTEKESDTWEQ